MQRKPLVLPNIRFHNLNLPTIPTPDSAIKYLETLSPSDIEIIGYNHHDPLPRVTMAQEK